MLEKKHQVEISEKTQGIENYKTLINEREIKIKDLEEERTNLKKLIDAQGGEKKQLAERIDELKEKLFYLNEMNAELKKVEPLASKIKEENLNIKEQLRIFVQKHDEEIKDMKNAHERMMIETELAYEKKLHESSKKEMEEYEKKVQLIKKEHTEEIGKIKTEYENRLSSSLKDACQRYEKHSLEKSEALENAQYTIQELIKQLGDKYCEVKTTSSNIEQHCDKQ